MSESNRARLGGGVIALFFLAVGLLLMLYHSSTPSDGARLEPGEQVWRPTGIVVTPVIDQDNGLRKGDIVVAINGRSVLSDADSILNFAQPRASYRIGESARYSVIRVGKPVDLDLTLVAYPLSATILKNWSLWVAIIITQIVLSFVFFMRPLNHAARALFLFAWSFVHTFSWGLGLQVGDITGAVGFWLFQLSASGAWLIFWAAGVEFTLAFPNDHAILKKYPGLSGILYVVAFAILALTVTIAWIVTPTPLDRLAAWNVGDLVVAAVAAPLMAGLMVHTYRSTPSSVARLKIRWLAFAVVLGTGFGFVFWFLPDLLLGHPLLDANGLGLSLIPFPFILAITILRDKLFDIDVIIRRTLIYSILTASLALIYFGVVIILQQLLRFLTSAGGDLAIILSTLAIAALFNPLRTRIQYFIDRRFFRRKYDAQKVLARFAVTARDETDLARLTNELIHVVDESIQPASISVWLKPTSVPGRYRQ